MKNITQSLKVVVLALALSLGISYVSAWTAPTATPPSGNTSAPLNVSGNTQYKSGALGVGGIAVFDSKVGVGRTPVTYQLEVAGDILASNAWLRTTGDTGWYSDTYGGGWRMTDTSWIRAYNNKGVYTPGEMQAGTIRGTNVCIGADCRSSWPSVSASTDLGGGTLSNGYVNATGCVYVGQIRTDGGPYDSSCPVGYYVNGMRTNWGGASLDSIYVRCCKL